VFSCAAFQWLALADQPTTGMKISAMKKAMR
jgi:hypothetical protein